VRLAHRLRADPRAHQGLADGLEDGLCLVPGSSLPQPAPRPHREREPGKNWGSTEPSVERNPARSNGTLRRRVTGYVLGAFGALRLSVSNWSLSE